MNFRHFIPRIQLSTHTYAALVAAIAIAMLAGTSGSEAAPPFKAKSSKDVKKNGVIIDEITIATKELHRTADPESTKTENATEVAHAGAGNTEPTQNAASASASVSEAVETLPEYRIGPGDVLFFRSYNDASIGGEVVVRYDGYISLPLVPDIHVENASRDVATERVRESYSQVFSDPQISLSVRSVGSKSYYVMGNVNSPREFAYLKPLTLIDAINNAGGLRLNRRGGDSFTGAQGQLVKALIIRHVNGERQVTEYDLKNLSRTGAHAADTPILPRDTVFVPEGVNLIYILGEVARPSVYELAEGMTMLRMLALAGGPRWQSGRLRQAILMREVDDDNTDVQLVNVRKMLKGRGDILLEPGDIIYIPQRHLTRSSEFVRQFTQTISPLINLYTQAYDAINITDRLDSRILNNNNQSGSGAGANIPIRSFNIQSPTSGLAGPAIIR